MLRLIFNPSFEKLSKEEWISIARQSDEIGYFLVQPETEWVPIVKLREEISEEVSKNRVKLPTGHLTIKQLELLFSHLPVDITFIDENDRVTYFSSGPERIFTRTKAIIGRKVQNCHPPKSVHIVEQILNDFKNNKRDNVEFWLSYRNKFVNIRYFAIRDTKGQYKGTLEMTQDISDIRELKNEKRVFDPL